MHRVVATHSLLLVLAVSLLASSPALGDTPSAADKETARALLLDGRAKLAAHDYDGALRSFKAAHAIMHVPTTGLDYANGLAAKGRLVEARVLAIEVSRMPPQPGEPEAFADARMNAAGLAERLAARIPAVVVTVKGLPPGVEPKVTLDGAPLPAATLGLPRKLDPGAHVLAASAAGFAPAEQRVEIGETAKVTVELTLSAAAVQSVPTPPKQGSRVPGWAWVSGGVGLAALGASVAFVIDYASVRGTIARDCPNDLCDPQKYAADHLPDQLGRWNRDLGLFIGLGVLGAGAVTAAVVGVARPRRDPPRVTAFSPWVAGCDGGRPRAAGNDGGHPQASGCAAGLAFTGAF
jgi:hypothetical protein